MLFYSFFLLLSAPVRAESAPPVLEIIWDPIPGQARTVLQVSMADLEKTWRSKLKETRERHPQTGTLERFQGVSFNAQIEAALEKLTPSERARVDLVMVEGRSGVAYLPRSFLTRHSVLWGSLRAEKMPAPSALSLIVPWTSRAHKIEPDLLPTATYFVLGPKKVRLSAYRGVLPPETFLKNRRDPLQLRGEKRFIQTCLGCHVPRDLQAMRALFPRTLQAGESLWEKHTNIPAVAQFTNLDREALRHYLVAVERELVQKP
jgi:hypothetical protein